MVVQLRDNVPSLVCEQGCCRPSATIGNAHTHTLHVPRIETLELWARRASVPESSERVTARTTLCLIPA